MADFLEIKTAEDLQRLVDDDIQESLILEYKRSDALARSNAQRDELCKDVSAFANSAGGQIVYGIQEQDHHPVQVDTGTEGVVISREWIEQVINSNVQPRLSAMTITPIELQEGRYAYILTVPASSTAHQAADKKYYKRFNFQSVAMHDYEIRDVMKRSSTAAPFIHLSFDLGRNTASARLIQHLDQVSPVPIFVSVGNKSAVPAFHTLVTIGIDAQLEITDVGRFDKLSPTQTSAGHHLNQLQKRVSAPEFLPIFQEVRFQIGDRPPCISFEFRTAQDQYLVRCTIQTPGFSNIEDWIVHRSGTKLTLEGPLPAIHPL